MRKRPGICGSRTLFGVHFMVFHSFKKLRQLSFRSVTLLGTQPKVRFVTQLWTLGAGPHDSPRPPPALEEPYHGVGSWA